MLAHEFGITQSQLSRIENGRHRIRDLDKLTHYARTLGVPAELLWFELDEPVPRLPVAEPLQLRNGTEIPAVTSVAEPGCPIRYWRLSTNMCSQTGLLARVRYCRSSPSRRSS
ncbi:helix-turn-helix domain-containing protein [Nocardia wallacei]|uniref:helix-turn-helix domain-containing protein n=1 Tax=Nocardia wallacei TaxID=480035 RepID=UPI003CC7C7BA